MRKLRAVAIGLVLVLAAAQAIRPDRTNPPADPAASFEAMVHPAGPVAEVLSRSCRDCHTHHTVWPWYSKIAPVSWLVVHDVREGRAHMNLSEWNSYSPEKSRKLMRDMCEEVKGGDMPLSYYTPLHPAARLTDKDVAAVCSLGSATTP